MPSTEERKQLKYVQLLQNPPSKKVMYYLSSFTFIVAIILLAFAVRPTILIITEINKEIKEKDTINTALEKKIESMVELDKQYAEFEDTLEGLKLIFPSSGNFSLFLSNIDAVISRNRFVLQGISFTEYDSEYYDISSTVLAPWTVQLSVKGPQNNIDNLFDDLEAMPMYPVIERFSYGEDGDDGLKTYSIGMRIYHVDNNKFYGNANESN
jgi:hypothetical protein